MRRVRLTSAVKVDDPFPICGDPGDIIGLPDHAAVTVIKQGWGEYHGPPPEPGPSRAELERQEAELRQREVISRNSGTSSPVSEEDAPAEEPPKRPYGNAPKSAWVRYAAAVDPELTEERAESWTKADLMSRYGERL